MRRLLHDLIAELGPKCDATFDIDKCAECPCLADCLEEESCNSK